MGRPKNASPATKRRKRARITDATRAKVGKLAKAGLSGSKIAKAVGISLPSVHNIKKARLVRKVKAKGNPAAKKAPAKKIPAKKPPAKRVVPKRRSPKKQPVVKAPATNAPAAVTEPPAPPAAKNG